MMTPDERERFDWYSRVADSFKENAEISSNGDLYILTKADRDWFLLDVSQLIADALQSERNNESLAQEWRNLIRRTTRFAARYGEDLLMSFLEWCIPKKKKRDREGGA